MLAFFFNQVEELLKKHTEMFDRLNVRLGFAADDSSYRLRHALRRGSGYSNHIDALHQIAVIPDIKRSSPTAKPPHEIASFPDAGDLAVSFRDSGAGLFPFLPTNRLTSACLISCVTFHTTRRRCFYGRYRSWCLGWKCERVDQGSRASEILE